MPGQWIHALVARRQQDHLQATQTRTQTRLQARVEQSKRRAETIVSNVRTSAGAPPCSLCIAQTGCRTGHGASPREWRSLAKR
eukprot:6212252-Pleurochrysis_carterae.AAC.6